MTISELCTTSFNAAKDKGFHDTPRSLLESIALIHSELSEAVEEIRAGRPSIWVDNNTKKPEGALIEMADAVIRIADLCGSQGWDLETAIGLKLEFNKSRSYKHGKLL